MMTSQPSPSVARVAFYSDVEREIFKAFSGCKVIVTHYLHLVDPAPSQQVPSVVPNLKDISNLQSILGDLLNSPELLPDRGTLGFGLAHLHPVTFNRRLEDVIKYLKGQDAHVYRACRELQLHPSRFVDSALSFFAEKTFWPRYARIRQPESRVRTRHALPLLLFSSQELYRIQRRRLPYVEYAVVTGSG